VPKSITATFEQETPQTVAITIHGPDGGSGPELIGYLEITAVPTGVRVEGWNADDSPTFQQLILKGEM
jgi:hypothetical protein